MLLLHSCILKGGRIRHDFRMTLIVPANYVCGRVYCFHTRLSARASVSPYVSPSVIFCFFLNILKRQSNFANIFSVVQGFLRCKVKKITKKEKNVLSPLYANFSFADHLLWERDTCFRPVLAKNMDILAS